MSRPLATTPQEFSKLAKGLCIVKYCRNKSVKQRCLCPKHRRQRSKQINPIGYCFDVLRQNAKRRGKFFDLTLQQFKFFVREYNYLELKGKTKLSLSIDCIKNDLGYTKSNIRAITLQDNSWKRNYVDYAKKEDDIPCPF